jgi:hypothetical protein
VAWLTVRRAAGGRRAPRTQLVGVATRAGASVPAAVGTSRALERAPTRSGLSGRPALWRRWWASSAWWGPSPSSAVSTTCPAGRTPVQWSEGSRR